MAPPRLRSPLLLRVLVFKNHSHKVYKINDINYVQSFSMRAAQLIQEKSFSPLLEQLYGVERMLLVSEALPAERRLVVELLQGGEEKLFPPNESRCPFKKMLGAPAKILAYTLVEKLLGSIWTLVENDLALREAGTVPLVAAVQEPVNTYMSPKHIRQLLAETPSSQQHALLCGLMKNTISEWCSSLGPKSRVLSMSGAQIDKMLQRLAPGLEQNSPAILSSVSSTLRAALDSNQDFFLEVSAIISRTLSVTDVRAHALALSVLRDSARLHVNTFMALSSALQSMPEGQVFTLDRNGNLMLHEAMMCRVADELEQYGRRTPRLGCPASRATATLRNGREVRVLGRYLAWMASVHEECFQA